MKVTNTLKSSAIAMLASLLYAGLPATAKSQDTPHVETDKQHCKTGATKASGSRRSCYIKLYIEAPDGHAFLPESIKNQQIAHRGTGHGCTAPVLVYEDNGLARYVVAVKASGNARSSKGAFAGGGRVECGLSGRYGQL